MERKGTVPALRAARLLKRFGACRALDGVDLLVARGEATALAGANGAGKTTLLKCAPDLTSADSGRAEPFGVPSGLRSSRARIAYLPERLSPPYDLLGSEFLGLTLELSGARYERARAERRLAELELDRGALDRPVCGGSFPKA